VLVLPLVDLYSAERDEKAALLAELESASQVAAMINRFETGVAEKTAQLAALEARTINAESLPALRTKLVDMARETGCSLRRLNVGTPMSRPWHDGVDPTATGAEGGANRAEDKSRFLLQFWPLSVSLSGNDANLRNLLERMEADGMLMHTKVFDMRAASASRKTLNLDMELWYYNLARGG
jgi:hypothetical protein